MQNTNAVETFSHNECDSCRRNHNGRLGLDLELNSKTPAAEEEKQRVNTN